MSDFMTGFLLGLGVGFFLWTELGRAITGYAKSEVMRYLEAKASE